MRDAIRVEMRHPRELVGQFRGPGNVAFVGSVKKMSADGPPATAYGADVLDDVCVDTKPTECCQKGAPVAIAGHRRTAHARPSGCLPASNLSVSWRDFRSMTTT